jgi:hypothetical protein
MPIRIQLWRGDTQIGLDGLASDIDPEIGHSTDADRQVDALITGVHRGDHGPGWYRIDCDHIDTRAGLFVGSYYSCDLAHPKQVHAAGKAQ